MRTHAINIALLRTISEPRLRTYLDESSDRLDEALMLYERNVRLSESFYTPLQSLEVCLRNSLNRCMKERYGADWLYNGAAPLADAAARMIAEAQRSIQQQATSTADTVVPELKFAFWVSLLAPRYDATLWRSALYRAFRSAMVRKRSEIHGRMNAIRRFRNRVAHHEPIFRRDLLKVHAEIIEAIGWMCADTQDWTAHHSRSVAVISADGVPGR